MKKDDQTISMFEETAKTTAVPLAERMRPLSLREFMGQSHIAEEGSLLRRAIMLDRLGSCIFWGPPGCGKTTLARNHTRGGRVNKLSYFWGKIFLPYKHMKNGYPVLRKVPILLPFSTVSEAFTKPFSSSALIASPSGY